jgi:hypothetical protein
MQDISKFLPTLRILRSYSPCERREALDAACQKAQPDVKRRGGIFEVGEILEIKGGYFKVHAIGKNGITLHGMPSEVYNPPNMTPMTTPATRLQVTPIAGEPDRFLVASQSRPGLDHVVDMAFTRNTRDRSRIRVVFCERHRTVTSPRGHKIIHEKDFAMI